MVSYHRTYVTILHFCLTVRIIIGRAVHYRRKSRRLGKFQERLALRWGPRGTFSGSVSSSVRSSKAKNQSHGISVSLARPLLNLKLASQTPVRSLSPIFVRPPSIFRVLPAQRGDRPIAHPESRLLRKPQSMMTGPRFSVFGLCFDL